MIVHGHYNLERREDVGKFKCPSCMTDSSFTVYRTYEYFHLYFIPLFRQKMLAESLQCDHCTRRHPITVLGVDAPQITSAYEASKEGGCSVAENLGNVVALTEVAANEILRLRNAAQFGDDVVTRIMPDESHPNTLLAKFDYAMADGRDWIGRSRGITIVIDRRDAAELYQCMVDFRDGHFCRST